MQLLHSPYCDIEVKLLVVLLHEFIKTLENELSLKNVLNEVYLKQVTLAKKWFKIASHMQCYPK